MQARAIFLSLVLAALLSAGFAEARVVPKPVKYTLDGTHYEGVLVFDDAKPGPRPGVLVLPEWWGLNDYAKNRARQLAEMGYIAFVADMYGGGKVTRDVKQAEAWSGEVYSKPGAFAARSKAALDALRNEQGVDKAHLGAIGFCFGGTALLKLVYSGEKLDGAVVFHGGLMAPDANEQKQIHASLAILHGAEDTFTKPEEIEKMKKALEGAKADWYMVTYAQAQHAFTNPEADKFKIPGIGYNEKAAKRSWAEMEHFFRVQLGR